MTFTTLGMFMSGHWWLGLGVAIAGGSLVSRNALGERQIPGVNDTYQQNRLNQNNLTQHQLEQDPLQNQIPQQVQQLQEQKEELPLSDNQPRFLQSDTYRQQAQDAANPYLQDRNTAEENSKSNKHAKEQSAWEAQFKADINKDNLEH
ncbi:MAG: hypothetical protein QM632_04095 [Micrococcaceae bacterium]